MQDELQAAIVSFLKNGANYPHATQEVRHVETHISHVFLTGEYAYKLKKAVKFDFLDFSTLERRKHFCFEELRLNSRFAPDLYLEVLSVNRTGDTFSIGGPGEVVDYLIKMHQFDESSLFDQLAQRGELRQQLLLEITDIIARFHTGAAREPKYWGWEYVAGAMNQNLAGCAEFSPAVLDRSNIERLRELSAAVLSNKRGLITRRQTTHVRQLHGDLHLKNMCVYKNRAALFDGIEFNPELSNCDVWADLAFLIMDLLFRGLEEKAALVWNHYLQETDDFEGFELLDLYVSYRAAIRARISCLEIESAGSEEAGATLAATAESYIKLALETLKPHSRRVIAIGGLAGTGKSTLSSILSQSLSAVHIRSDAVRKHLCGVPVALKAPPSAYTVEMNSRTYRGMLERANRVLESNHPVVLDAVYHSQRWRDEVEEFADKLGAPFVGIWCEVPLKTAQERVRLRTGDISDADESVVSLQQTYPLGDMHWHRLDTSQHETQTAECALGWLL